MTELREPSYLVLTALTGEPLHGYGVLREVEAITAGRIRLRTGTLYATLDRLAGDGLVATAGEEVVDGRLRRYYTLTEAGRRTLAAEAERRAADSVVALTRLRLSGESGLSGGLA